MKRTAKSIIALLAGVLISSFAYAQMPDFGGGFPGGGFPGGGFPGGFPGGMQGGFPQMQQNLPDAGEIAKTRADEMNRELTLTAKQYKKIVKHFKKEVEFERQNMSFGGRGMMGGGMMGQMPQGGMPQGQRPQGAPQAQQRQQGERPQGNRPEGAQQGQRGQRGEFNGQRPEGTQQREMPAEMQEMMKRMQEENAAAKAKFDAKQDKNLKKVLTPEQYERWRGKHPLGR